MTVVIIQYAVNESMIYGEPVEGRRLAAGDGRGRDGGRSDHANFTRRGYLMEIATSAILLNDFCLLWIELTSMLILVHT